MSMSSKVKFTPNPQPRYFRAVAIATGIVPIVWLVLVGLTHILSIAHPGVGFYLLSTLVVAVATIVAGVAGVGVLAIGCAVRRETPEATRRRLEAERDSARIRRTTGKEIAAKNADLDQAIEEARAAIRE